MLSAFWLKFQQRPFSMTWLIFQWASCPAPKHQLNILGFVVSCFVLCCRTLPSSCRSDYSLLGSFNLVRPEFDTNGLDWRSLCNLFAFSSKLTFLISHLILILLLGQNNTKYLYSVLQYEKEAQYVRILSFILQFKEILSEITRQIKGLCVCSLGTWLPRAQPLRSPIGIWMKWQTWLSSCRTRLGSGCFGSPAISLPTKGHYFY